MDEPVDTLRRAAHDATQGWSPVKAAMAIRAVGIAPVTGARESLDSIAADTGVSRETVRRARNDLVAAMEEQAAGPERHTANAVSLAHLGDSSTKNLAIARALRRVLTMTGQLAWDEVLTGWARAGGKHPYTPLPTDVASLRLWARRAGGFIVTPEHSQDGPVTVAAVAPEDLDHVSTFLYRVLRDQAAGVDRLALLEAAESAGLKPTTIATALSQHPAVMRLGRGTWALRGRREADLGKAPRVAAPRHMERARPTTFGWAGDGSLSIEFSTPRGPSPVVAVPRAVADLIEGREFVIEHQGKPLRITVRHARLWGFGPLLSRLGISGGERAQLLINLLAGTASLSPTDRNETRR